MICECLKTTEAPPLSQLPLLLHFVEVNGNSQSTGFRPPILTCYKKVRPLSCHTLPIFHPLPPPPPPPPPHLHVALIIFECDYLCLHMSVSFFWKCLVPSYPTRDLLLFVCVLYGCQILLRIRDSSYSLLKSQQKRRGSDPKELIEQYKVFYFRNLFTYLFF